MRKPLKNPQQPRRKPSHKLQRRVKTLLKQKAELLAQVDEMCRDNRALECRLAYVTGQRDLAVKDSKK